MASTFPRLGEEAWERFVGRNALEMISVHDMAGNFLHVTRSCDRMLGYRPGDLVGHSAYEFFRDEDLDAIHGSHATVIESHRTAEPAAPVVVYRFQRRDGQYAWLETISRAVAAPEGLEVDGGDVIYATSRDVSERVAQQRVVDDLLAVLRTRAPEPDAWEPFVTRCAWTGRIRFRGEWLEVDEYLRRRFGLHVSHGIMPELARRLLGEPRHRSRPAAD